MTITLGYWDIRAKGEACRYLLRYSGVDWTDRRIEMTEEGYKSWYSEKLELGLDLPNLPYLIDGDIKITQSVAICRYLGRKFGLVPGDDEKDIVKNEMIEQEAVDLRAAFQEILKKDQFEEKKPAYFENLEKKLEILDKYIGDGPFVLGEKLTYVDFMLYEFVSQIRKLTAERVDKAENLARFLQIFQELPQLQDYFNSEKLAAEVPINPSFSAFPG
ncbi:glutathione S-transferase Mu 2-like [Bolinopsis microptera]|uniref:glutathione S-transferase Mu 2-like n=1 Tax=Bolinopsis microptera TaxID=2820187 RepID=UPI0030796F85